MPRFDFGAVSSFTESSASEGYPPSRGSRTTQRLSLVKKRAKSSRDDISTSLRPYKRYIICSSRGLFRPTSQSSLTQDRHARYIQPRRPRHPRHRQPRGSPLRTCSYGYSALLLLITNTHPSHHSHPHPPSSRRRPTPAAPTPTPPSSPKRSASKRRRRRGRTRPRRSPRSRVSYPLATTTITVSDVISGSMWEGRYPTITATVVTEILRAPSTLRTRLCTRTGMGTRPG